MSDRGAGRARRRSGDGEGGAAPPRARGRLRARNGRADEEGVRRAVVAFLAREIDEDQLRAAGWAPAVRAPRWFARYVGGRVNSPYRMNGPAGPFTRFRGDRAAALYRLDRDGGWRLDPASGQWQSDDAPVRLHELARLGADDVEALYELDDWGGWYFDYGIGSWERRESPSASHYLGEVVLHEIEPREAARVAADLGHPAAVAG
ncbi:MAG: hypothetical protein M3N11_04585 [Actinomycetota bacterium]|nr:hypothetical protein [Actinomycetota bacterium]